MWIGITLLSESSMLQIIDDANVRASIGIAEGLFVVTLGKINVFDGLFKVNSEINCWVLNQTSMQEA